MKFKWLGTAGFEIKFDNMTFLIDPFISRTKGAVPSIPKSKYEFGPIDHVYLTHGHFDHAYDLKEILEKTGASLYCSKTLLNNFIEHGIPESQINPLEGNEQFDFTDYGVEILKSVHTKFGMKVILSKLLNPVTYVGIRQILRMARGFPKGEVLAYYFTAKKENFSFIVFGSGGWIEDIITEYDGKVDIFLAPYAGRYDMHEIIPRMASLFNPKVLIPHHWDNSFPPLSWELSIDKLRHVMSQIVPKVKLYVPEILKEVEIKSFDDFYNSIE
ncbi:MAG: MBL fold metallo-hydrolase [Candidatus Helarchaeota archaeon]